MPRPTATRLVTVALFALFALAAAKIWIGPLFVPREHRGDVLFGHYHLVDVYRGIPILLITVALALVVLSPARLRKPIGHRAFALVLGILVPFFAVDLGWSLFWVGARKPAYWLDEAHISRLQNAPDPELGFVRKPNIEWEGAPGDVEAAIHYRTDANGFHNPPDVGDDVDLVFVGDSYTEAAQVDEGDCFARLVGRELDRSVVNLGRGAYGPPQELIVLRRFGLDYTPDVVVWQLFEGNDLGDAQKFVEWREDPHRVTRSIEERYVHNSLLKPLFDATTRVRHRVFLRLEGDDRRFRLRYRFDPTYAEAKARGLEATLDSLREGAALCRENGARLIVLYLPIMLRVYGPWIRFEDDADRARCYPEVDGERRGWAAPIAAACDEFGVDFLDVTPTFRAHAAADRSKGLYIRTDEHLTRTGHEVVRDALVARLRGT